MEMQLSAPSQTYRQLRSQPYQQRRGGDDLAAASTSPAWRVYRWVVVCALLTAACMVLLALVA